MSKSNEKVSIEFSVEPRPGAAYTVKYGDVKYAKESDRAHEYRSKQLLTGKFRVVAEADDLFAGAQSREYVGKVLVDPTWRQIKAEARKAAIRTGDLHHIYLEGVRLARGTREDGTREIKLLMGS